MVAPASTALGAYSVANLLAVLAGGRYPNMTEQTAYTGAPSGAAAGVSMVGTDRRGVLAALVKLSMRAEPIYRQVVISFPAFVAGQTYTVTINGTAYAHLDVTGIEADTYTALEALIDVGATAAAVQSTAGTTSLLLFGIIETAFSVVVATSGGGATILATAEPETCTLRMFATENDTTSDAPTFSWDLVPGSEVAIDYRGFIQRIAVGGIQRLYVELASVAGHAADAAGANGTITYTPAYLGIGPCQKEEEVQL